MAEVTTSRIDPRARQKRKFSDYAPTYGAAIALTILLILNLAFTPGFASFNNFSNILVQVTPTMLVAIGMTFVIATGGIDLSVGSVMAIASAVTAVSLDYGAIPAVLLGLIVATAVGALNGALISSFRIQPIIITLAVLIAGRGIAQVISNGGQLIPFSNPTFEYLGKGLIAGIPVQILLLAAIVGLAIFVFRSTIFGRYIAAVGGNETAAHLAGVPTVSTKLSVYAVSGLLAGIAGLIYTARLGASDASKVGDTIELDAIAATVVGGTPLVGGRASIIGTVIGALIMIVITTSFNMNDMKYSWSLVIKAAIILLAVYLQRPKTN
ncbi:ABC transporter permease [Hymenobacter arizonensis]|uniref:Monosaccharide ABC transporter membrane protein, CUT2 family n=1 Tax=Hymenobacter arizonensis TaxID=1227077 RepID=A0A1I6BKG9_HYMAR|nr:ABC transporter permease [Hymenobacter arizonensis]SFQ81436.1 monosaccharide ABC transporter membrane protein, CUT2 family [Hymenobacter arizonensis]